MKRGNSTDRISRIATPSLLLALAASWTTVATADGLKIDDLPINGVASGQVTYGRRVLTLPPGEWRLIYKRERNSSTDGQGSTMLEAAFDQVVSGRLERTLTLMATKYSKNLNWIDEPCKSKNDSYWLEDRKRGMNDQFCTRVGFLSGVVDNARGEAFQSWARSLVAGGVAYSPEMPEVTVTRYTSYDYLRMSIAFNPQAFGIARSQRPERQFNDWHPEAIQTGSARAAVYQQLQAWAPTFAAAVERSFDGDTGLQPAAYGPLPLSQK